MSSPSPLSLPSPLAPDLPGAADCGDGARPRTEAHAWEGQRRPGVEPAHPHRGLCGPHVFDQQPEQAGVLPGPRQHRVLSPDRTVLCCAVGSPLCSEVMLCPSEPDRTVLCSGITLLFLGHIVSFFNVSLCGK